MQLKRGSGNPAPDAVTYTIMGLGSFPSAHKDMERFELAKHAFMCLTGDVLKKPPEEVFELVSADPDAAAVVFKIKPGTIRWIRKWDREAVS